MFVLVILASAILYLPVVLKAYIVSLLIIIGGINIFLLLVVVED